MKLRSILAVSALFLAVPSAAHAGKSKCKNKNAKPANSNRAYDAPAKSDDHWICVHKTKYYKKNVKCSGDYKLEGAECKKWKSAKNKCKAGQKICDNSYCVGALKKCKKSNKKGTPSTTCTGAGWRASSGKCVKTKKATDQRCPAGWFKAKFGPDHPKTSKLYCKTTA